MIDSIFPFYFEGKICYLIVLVPGPEVIKIIFILNSAEHEILNVHRYKTIKNFSIF